MSAAIGTVPQAARDAEERERPRSVHPGFTRLVLGLAGLGGLLLVWWIGTELLRPQASFLRRFHLKLGRVTVKNAQRPDAPSVSAASSSVVP